MSVMDNFNVPIIDSHRFCIFRVFVFKGIITVGAGDKMFWGRLAAHLAGVPVIVSALHSTGWPDGVGRINRWLTGITDGFIAVADAHGEFLRDCERFPPERVHVIRNGVDCARFRGSEANGALPHVNHRVTIRHDRIGAAQPGKEFVNGHIV